MKSKLVRDQIITIINECGAFPEWFIADKKEYESRLFDKLREELQEFIDNPCIEEAADIYEVWLAMLAHWDMVPLDVVSCANKKRKDHGGFSDRIILTGVDASYLGTDSEDR